MIKRYSKLVQAISMIWIAAVLVLFTLNVKFTEGSCSVKHFCFSVFGKHLQILTQVGHKFYFDAYKAIVLNIIQPPHEVAPFLLIVGAILFVYLANFIYDFFFEKKRELHLTLRPIVVLILFTLIFFLSYNRWLAFYSINKPIKYESIMVRYPLFLLEIFSIVLLVLSFGLKLKNIILKEKRNSEDILRDLVLSFGFGVSILVILLYFMALFKLLVFKYVVSLCLLLLVISLPEAYFWLKSLFTEKFTLKSKFNDPYIFLMLLAMLFMAQNLLELFRPDPMGFDDINVYINNPHLMATSGSLISGAMSYYWELFVSLGFVLYKNTTIALMISFLGSIFTFFGVYYMVGIYCKKRNFEKRIQSLYAIFAATFFYTLPSVVFQSSKDMKVDLGGIAVTLASLLLFFEWKDRKEKRYILFSSAALAGIALAIKYTNALFVFILAVDLIWILYQCQCKLKFRKKIVLVSMFLFVSIIPVLPISLRNIFQTNSLSVADIRFGRQENQEITLNPPLPQSDKYVSSQKQYMRLDQTGKREELGRYTGFDSAWKKYLLMPFRLIQNTYIYGPFIDMGYLLAVLSPLSLLFFLTRRKEGKKVKLLGEMVMLSGIFWLAWMFSASGVIWYGYSGMILLLFLMVDSWESIRQNFHPALYYIINFIIFVWFLTATVLRLSFLTEFGLGIEQVGLMYARGEINAEEYESMKFDPYFDKIKEINQEIEKNPSNPPRIYLVGTFYHYFFAQNDKTVVFDHLFDIFSYAYQDNDPKKTYQRFKNSGIEYVLFDKSMAGLDQTPDHTLTKKYDNFIDFVNINMNQMEILSGPSDQHFFFAKLK